MCATFGGLFALCPSKADGPCFFGFHARRALVLLNQGPHEFQNVKQLFISTSGLVTREERERNTSEAELLRAAPCVLQAACV